MWDKIQCAEHCDPAKEPQLSPWLYNGGWRIFWKNLSGNMYATTEDMVNNLISHIYPKGKVCYKPNAHYCFFSGHQECIQLYC